MQRVDTASVDNSGRRRNIFQACEAQKMTGFAADLMERRTAGTAGEAQTALRVFSVERYRFASQRFSLNAARDLQADGSKVSKVK